MKKEFKKVRVPREILQVLGMMSARESVRTGYVITEEGIVEKLVSDAWEKSEREDDLRILGNQKGAKTDES